MSTIQSRTPLADAADDAIVEHALRILRRRVRLPESYISEPQDLVNLLRLQLSERPQEVFAAVLLDARHGVIAIEEMFYGSLTGAAVYVGRVVRTALMHNAAALVIAHNHPSGIAEPSMADRELTERLRQALALVEVRLLDHVVVGSPASVPWSLSFAERGWL